MSLYSRKFINHGSRRLMERLRVPVARYNHRHFRILAFRGPFVSLMPWILIFADQWSKQTIIYSKSRGTRSFVSSYRRRDTSFVAVYVLPALINRFGKRFSIAVLIASGYISLYRSRARPDGNINPVSLFQPNSCSLSHMMISFDRSFSWNSDGFGNAEISSLGRWIHKWHENQLWLLFSTRR